MKNPLLALAALLWAVGTAHAENDAIAESMQKAMVWSRAAPPGKQAYVAFRKGFTLAQVPASARLHLFADSRYILWVNGRYVLRGPCRFDPKWPEYDSVDVRPFLQSGSNVLVVLVHHYGPVVNGRILTHAPGLTARLDIDGKETLSTDPTWRCSSRTRYLPSPSAWSSIPDVIDARADPGDWTTVTFDDATWDRSQPVNGGQWGALQPRTLPLAKETEVTGLKLVADARALASVLPLDLPAGKEIVVDVGRMVMAYGEVDLEAEAGSVLQIQYALRCVNGRPEESYGVGTTYTARAGRQSFLTGDQWGCHYLSVRCTAGRIKLHGFKLTDRRYPFERLGRFESSDPLLTRLWEISVYTVETVTDDGYGSDARERDEWLQDPAQPNFITTRVADAGPGPAGQPCYSDPRLLKNLLRHAALSQLPDGRIRATFPTDRHGDCHDFIDDYACQWGEALRLYFEATGDKPFVREMWPTLVKQMQWFLDRRTPRGLVMGREYASFDNPLAYITCEGATLNAFCYQALRDGASLGRVLDQSSQADLYEQAAVALAAAFNQYLWNSTEGAYCAAFYRERLLGPTAHAQLLALDRGLVPENRKPSVRKWFLANYQRPGGFHCCTNPDFESMVARRAGIDMPVTYYWVFQEFYRMNSALMDLEAIQEMRRRWAIVVERSQDTGTVMEGFGANEACHNYGAVPAYFLSSYVLGVRLDGPASNQRLLIDPRLGDLTRAEGTVVTEFGPVPVSWKRQDRELAFRFEVPPGVHATLRLPDGDPASLMLDGLRATTTAQDRYVTVNVGAGRHEGRLMVQPPPAPRFDASVSEQRLSEEPAPVVIVARTTPTSPAGLETEVIKDGLAGIAAITDERAAHDGGSTNAGALCNGTTKNGAGSAETLSDGRTFRGYGNGSALTFQLAGTHDLTSIRTFAGHGDARSSQSYTLMVAYASEPAKFVKLAKATLQCDAGASELRLRFQASGVVAVRFEFQDGPLGFNVYREVNIVGQPTQPK